MILLDQSDANGVVAEHTLHLCQAFALLQKYCKALCNSMPVSNVSEKAEAFTLVLACRGILTGADKTGVG